MEILKYWDKWNGTICCGLTKKEWDAEELKELVGFMTEKLSAAGVEKKETVAFVLGNSVAFPVMLLACLQLGASPLLLHESTTNEELNKYCELMDLSWICHDFLGDLSKIEQQEFTGKKYSIGLHSINIKLFKLDNSNNCFSQEATIYHGTSGTYGSPQLCLRSQEAAIAEAVNYTGTISCYDHSRIVITTPLNHAFAYGFGLMSSLVSNSSMVLDPIFNPKKVLREQLEKEADILMIVPPMAKSLIFLKKKNPSYKLPKYVFYAGTKCDDLLKKELEELYGIELYTIYGSTETGAISTSCTGDKDRMGVGKVLNNVSIKLVNQEKYSDFPEGSGEIRVKSTSMMEGYLQDSHQLTKDDYFPTGDVGYFDEKNNLHLIGRVKDVININGLKIDPTEVENVLLEYENIIDAVVYPGRSSNGNEIVLASLESDDSELDLDELRSYCKRKLNSYKVPAIFHLIEKIPRTTSGKCLKIKLPGYYHHDKSLAKI